ncbi:MAG: hypothetical protein ACUVS7_00715 [Bryobacteraceae bacterium]
MKHGITLLAALAAALPLCAQMPGDAAPIRAWPGLVKFLELTSNQILALGRIELEWQRYLAGKARRAAEVEKGIREATLAEVVDPMALGLRYMELEAICRESRDQDRRTRELARKVLNDTQLARIAALEQAYRLLPLVAQADAAHLVDAPLPGPDPARLGPVAARPYPGCRFAARAPAPAAPMGQQEN